MLAAVAVPGTPALIVAVQWLVACLLGALIGWGLLLFFLRRRLGSLRADHGPLFAAVLAACFGAAALSMAAHALALRAPFVAAPAQLLFLIWFYLYPDVGYVTARIRWLSVFYFFAQTAPYWPAKPSNGPTVVLPQVPGLLGTLTTLGDFTTLAPILVGILPLLYGRARQLALVGASDAPPATARLTLAIAGAGALALLAAAALTTAPADPGALALNIARVAYFAPASLVPVGVGLALLSGRRYDREALARRALGGTTMAAALLAVYAAGVAAVRVFFPNLSGPGEFYLPFIFSIGTVLAALYRPLRSQVEPFIARRWFPETYQAGLVLNAALTTWRGETQPDQLCQQLVAEVESALRPAALALWVRVPSVPGSLRVAGAPALIEATDAPTTAEAPGDERAPMPADAALLRLFAAAPAATRDRATESVMLRADDPARATLERTARVVAMDHLPPKSVASGALRAAGLELALPLVSAGSLEGVLALAPRPGSRSGAGSDVRELLAAVAAAVAPTLAAARTAHERAVEERQRERVDQELRTARRIQESLLPKALPVLDGWHIATCYQPAREVGGDFYDFIELSDGHLGIVIGDVTDKGIPAALVMATTRSMLRAVATQPAASPGGVLAQVNALLCADLPPSMFVTCFYAILEPATGRLRFANAGQDLPYLRRADGSVGELHARGMPLGLMPDMVYDESATALALGDAVLFYSDGLVEAHNPAREMFGFPRLRALLGGDAAIAAPIPLLLRELADFTRPDWEQEDDITLVALRRPE
jgi:serine phosphatase RsbU (regulator of sigma subunit)